MMDRQVSARGSRITTAAVLLILAPSAALAGGTGAPTTGIDTGDTAWLLVCTALVLLMTPGLALFYGGMVRSKNVLNTLMQSFSAVALVSVLWALVGYSLAFSSGGAFVGGLSWIGLRHVGLTPNPDYGATVPHQAFMAFQMMFAVITPALISGAIAERMKFSAYVIFMAVWSVVVYAPLAHMVWGVGGFLRNLGALDFAGGTVVHISSGVSALVLAIMLGKRHTGVAEDLRPHNLPLTLIGTALLWFGWFGFNAGSAIGSGGLAASAFVVTHLAAAAAALTWVLMEWAILKQPTALGLATGGVAGLVAITPASGYVGPLAAMAIGMGVAVISFYGIRLKTRLGYDDTLDVFGVHGMGGMWGALATGLFATTAVNAGGANGLLAGGGFALLGKQLVGIMVAAGYASLVTFLLASVLKRTIGIRVDGESEITGLDLTQHGETGYSGPVTGAEGEQEPVTASVAAAPAAVAHQPV